MVHGRSKIAGGTDYTGVSLEDIVADLRAWQRNTDEAVQLLEGHLSEACRHRSRLDSPKRIERYIQHFIELFKRYSGDFARLVAELPAGVEQRHVHIVRQIYESSRLEDEVCANFSHGNIHRAIKDNSLRYCLLDKIYEDTRGMIVDYFDLSNLAPRLETFVGPTSSVARLNLDDIDVLELKPNICGIGLNLNYIFKRIMGFFRGRKRT